MRSLVAALLACCGLAGCVQPPAPSTLVEHEDGRRIYTFRCYFCHGYSGDARTLAASMVEPAPRDFTLASGLDEQRVVAALRSGIPGTAMASFDGTLSQREMQLVARFVLAEFVRGRAPNTRYHTAENGWPDHDRYAPAYDFATGKIALDEADESLSPSARAGKRLFMTACISCHDRARVSADGAPWQAQPIGRP